MQRIPRDLVNHIGLADVFEERNNDRFHLAGYTLGEQHGRIFARALSEMFAERYIASSLLDEENDQIRKAQYEIRQLAITNILYEDGVVYIKTQRPGVIIGLRGADFDQYTEFFKQVAEKYNLPFKKIQLIEDTVPFEDDLMYGVNLYLKEEF
jgi:hypothetical protein